MRLASPGRVEVADDPLLGDADEPGPEVAHVDDLDGAAGIAGRQHLAAARDAHRPVREPPGRVVRPDDQPGAHVRMRPGNTSRTTCSHPTLRPP